MRGTSGGGAWNCVGDFSGQRAPPRIRDMSSTFTMASRGRIMGCLWAPALGIAREFGVNDIHNMCVVSQD